MDINGCKWKHSHVNLASRDEFGEVLPYWFSHNNYCICNVCYTIIYKNNTFSVASTKIMDFTNTFSQRIAGPLSKIVCQLAWERPCFSCSPISVQFYSDKKQSLRQLKLRDVLINIMGLPNKTNMCRFCTSNVSCGSGEIMNA